MCLLLRIIVLLMIPCQLVMSEILLNGDVLSRSRRQLLFPNITLLQLNAGVGTPTPIKTIFVNWAFQANFMLPWNRTQIPVDIFGANSGYDGDSRKKREIHSLRENEDLQYENDAKLYHFYKYVEEVVDGFGDNGTACVLQALCQIGADPLHYDDEEDLLHEIATFVLNPKNDMSHVLSVADEIYPYIAAYERGQKGKECNGVFGLCSTNLVDMFTIVHDTFS